MSAIDEQVEYRSARKLWAGALLAVLAIVVALGVAFPGEYTTRGKADLSFTIEDDFTNVRKIMVRTNAAKEIVTMGGDSEFVSQHWQEAAVDAAGKNIGQALLQTVLSSDPEWKLVLDGTLEVRTLGNYIGKHVIKLEQHVVIEPDEINSQANLVEGSQRLLDYAMDTRLFREGEVTRVDLALEQEIRTDAPWFAHGIADRRVRDSAKRALAKQEQAMRRLIEENADKAGLFPLR